MSPAAGTGRLVLLTTSPRLPAGLLSAAAWDAMRAADEVRTADLRSPQARAVADAGIAVAAAAPRAADLLDSALGRTLVWLVGADGDPGLAEAVAEEALHRSETGRSAPVVELLPGSWDPPGARLLDLVAVMDRLRSPGGCPWDAEQTSASLVGYLLEEAYETVEAVETGDRDHLREELGDLLLQIAFHARIAEEHPDDPWTVDDVAGGIVDKLIRRHPHVFAGADAPTAAHVEATWEVLKAAEKGRTSAVEGVPLGQPALALAAKLLARAERAGLDSGVRPEPLPADADVGEALLRVAAAARARGVDPEAALRAAARRLRSRLQRTESSG